MAGKRKLQVFVSSTYTDLIEERQTSVMAILKAGHIPAGMELFAAGDKSQLDVIKRWIDESDIYMLILGTRYGSIESDSGLSYTELEYDYARAQGKPSFALVMNDDAVNAKLKKSGSKYLEKENPEKLKAFRTKILSNMSSLFGDSKDIRSGVYESLLEIGQDHELDGWVRGTTLEEERTLRAKLTDLTASNERLQTEVQIFRQKQTSDTGSPVDDDNFGPLHEFLKSSSITVPSNVAQKGKDLDTDLYRIFALNKGLYARGVTIGSSASARSNWYEKHVYSVFVTHRLLRLERSTDGTRSYILTDRGLDYAIWIDMNSLPAI
jgi:hypothetical protein